MSRIISLSRLGQKWGQVPNDACPHFFHPLVAYRIFFGLLMFVQVAIYFKNDWIAKYFLEPSFHFHYFGFYWVKPWSGDGMVYHFVALGALSICISFGLFYRVSMALFCLGFTYVFLLDQALYLNHYYFIILISFLMIFIPAHSSYSIDSNLNPKLKSLNIPQWSFTMIKSQIGLVYLFAGIAKLNEDWLSGRTLEAVLSHDATNALGIYLSNQLSLITLMSFGAMLLDLLAWPLLLIKRTRAIIFGLLLVFHCLNAYFFNIGIFPFMMMGATAIFLFDNDSNQDKSFSTSKITTILLGVYFLIQVVIPLRHHLYPGNASWTEEGHRFAWRMILNKKDGQTVIYVRSPQTQEEAQVNLSKYLTSWQIDEMSAHPELIRQFSHHIAQVLNEKRQDDVEVRASSKARLNGRELQFLIDPEVNLAREPETLRHKDWIIPLKKS